MTELHSGFMHLCEGGNRALDDAPEMCEVLSRCEKNDGDSRKPKACPCFWNIASTPPEPWRGEASIHMRSLKISQLWATATSSIPQAWDKKRTTEGGRNAGEAKTG